MAVEMEGLEFQIEAKSTEACKGIDALAASFTRLKSALTGKRLDDMSRALDTVSKAAGRLKSAPLEGLSDMLTGLGSVKIPPSIPKQLTEISRVMSSLTFDGTELEGLASALTALGTVKISVAVPTNLWGISAALGNITTDDVDRVERLSAALKNLDGIKIPNLSKAAKAMSSAARKAGENSSKRVPAKNANFVPATDGSGIIQAENASRKLNTVLTSVRGTLKGLSQETLTWGRMLKNVGGQYAAAFRGVRGDLGTVAEGFQTAVESAKGFGEKLSNALSNSAESADKLKTVLHNIAIQSTEGLATLPLRLPAAFSKAGSAIKPLIGKAFGAVSSGVSSDFSKAFPGLEKLTSQLNSLGGAFGGVTGKMQGLAAAHPLVAAAFTALTVVVKGFLTEMKKLASTAFTAAKKLFGYMANAARKVKSEVISLSGKALKGFCSGITSAGKQVLSRFTKPFSDALKSFTAWKNAIGRIAFYRAVRSAVKMVADAFKTGIDNLYQYSRLVGTQFAPAMNSLATSAQYLKNSFGAMTAPLIQALAPAIDFIIDKFVSLLNIIGKVFAALTGKKTFSVAKKAAASYGGAMEDAGSSAKKAAKEIRDATIGIDELNIISPPDDSGSGSGGGGTSFGDMFEEVEIPSEILDWAAEIKAAIELGDWRGVGEILANKLNDIVDKWDSYSWGKRLGEKINNALNLLYGFLTTFDFEKLGRKIAGFFNGIFDTVDFDLLGRTFAAKWNALFDFICGFVTTLNWKKIGLSIAEAVNGFIDEIHWAKIGQTISEALKGIFLMINTAITEIHWGQLAEGIANMLNNVDWYGVIYGALSVITNALAALKEFIDSFIIAFEWSNTARQIYTAINDAFASVDWSGLGTTLGNAFKTVFNFLREIISGINWYEIGNDIAKFLNGIDWVGALSSLAKSIAAGVNAAVRAVKGFIENINIIEIAKAVAASINKFFADIDWKEAGRTLSKGIEKALDFMITFMQTVDWDAVGRHIAEFFENIDWDTLLTKWGQLMGEFINAKLKLIDVSGILEVGGNIVKGLFDGVIAEINATPGGIVGWLASHFIDLIINGVKGLLGIHSPSTVFKEIGTNIVQGLLLGITGAWGSILSFLSEKLEGIKKAFLDAWEYIKTHAIETWENITKTLSDVWESLKAAAAGAVEQIRKSVSEAWENLKTATAEAWNTIKTTVSTVWENLKTTAQTVFDTIRTTVSDVWDKIKTISSDVWNEIKTTLSSLWDNIKSTAATAFNTIKETISTVWENLKTTTATVWNTVKTGLNTVWNNLKTTAVNIFNGIKTTVSTAWSNIQTATSTVWNGIKTTLSTLWGGLKTTATTVFNGIKTTIETVWKNIQTTSSAVWNTIKTTVIGVWNNLKNEAVSGFNNIKSTISTAWTNIKTDAVTAWGNIKTTLTQAWNSLKTTAGNSFDEIKSAIKNKWDEIVRSAGSWGSDLCGNIASGISKAIGKVTRAARDVADTVSSYLHFTEPDVGPLSNFHTFMPDMLHLMAKGITDNSYLAENAAYDLAERVSKTLNTGINPAMALELDTADLRYYSSEKFARSISAGVENRVEFTSDGFEEAMENFYREYLQPTINQMADDMRRQADKDEHPIVQIGSRYVNEAVETQRKANGYQFTK